MTVAVANKGRKISPHFGHSDGCIIYSIENQQIIAEKYIENPLLKLEGGISCHSEGAHKSNSCSCRFFASFLLHETNVDVVVTGEIGEYAAQNFSRQGIKVITGVKGGIEEYLQEFLREKQWVTEVAADLKI